MSQPSMTKPGAVVLALLVLSAVAVSGCADRRAADPGQSPGPAATAGDVDAAGPAALVGELQRELAAMRSTHYQHTTRVDEHTGKYFYDCSGMVDYTLGRVLPADAAALPVSTSVRPLAGDIEHYLHQGMAGPLAGWQPVPRVADLRPGDVVAWLVTEDSTNGDTGHVMVVLEPARRGPRAGEWLVRVADSTLSPHASDTRHTGETGLGAGTIGLVVDDHGGATAFYWRGGVSTEAKPTEIALGRPS
jgi:hypothetical protein